VVVLDKDGVSDFDALASRKHDKRAQLYAFDMLARDGEEIIVSEATLNSMLVIAQTHCPLGSNNWWNQFVLKILPVCRNHRSASQRCCRSVSQL
jgi:hypothetical protein